MDRGNRNRTWSSLFKGKAIDFGNPKGKAIDDGNPKGTAIDVDCASTPAETPELYLKLASQCLEQADRISSPPKFNEQQCKYLVDKLGLAIRSTSSIIKQIETEFLSLASPENKASLLEIFKVLYSMGKEVEDFTESCCGESWIQSAILLTNMWERVATIGFNLEFCTIVLSETTIGVRGSLRSFDVAGLRQAEAEIVKEMANIDEMNLIRDLSAITKSNGSSSAAYQLASFLLGRLEMVRLRSSATSLTSIKKWHLQMNLSLKQTQVSLGKGTSASVHRAKWLGGEVAKKTFYGPKNGDFLQEVSILEGLSHPNIVSLLWYTTDEKRSHLVMELMDGDLHGLMQERMEENGDQSPPFCIAEALDLILQVGEGMSFLHEKRIVHRDLKSHNILVKYGDATKSNMKYYLHVKVADFGLSKTKEHSAYANMTLNVGTTRWMAPELMRIANDDARKVELKYPFKSDVYSFAMVCSEILTGDVPFSGLSVIGEVKSLVLRGGRPQLPHECPDRLRTLIEACWGAEASTRPSFGVICEELRNVKYGNLMTYWIESIPQCSGAFGATTARLVANLSNSRGDLQQIAAYGICLRARKSVGHRTCIANEGAIPLLVALLLSPDQRTQENAFSALLELSIDDCNKRRIICAGAIDPIVEVLMSGSVAAQDNAAEMLFILSLVEENKVTIGNSGAIRGLVQLEACQAARTKFDAAIAILSLCIFQGNKARAVEAEVSPLLLNVIEADPAILVEKALMNILGDQSTPQIQEQNEFATLFLLTFCSHDPGYIKQVKESNAIEPLIGLTHSRNFSARAKWKASALVELLMRPEVDVRSTHRVEGLQM